MNNKNTDLQDNLKMNTQRLRVRIKAYNRQVKKNLDFSNSVWRDGFILKNQELINSPIPFRRKKLS